MILRRFLRHNDLAPLLAKAAALLEPGWGIGVVQGGRLLAAHGLGDDTLERIQSHRCSAAFSLDGASVGHVIAAPCSGEKAVTSIASAQHVADFLAQSIGMLLRQDEARRALAQDTLQKYRELALLHRATVGLNSSLRLRQVGRALLAECESGALPTEMGMLFLRDPATGVMQPFSSFGPAWECAMDRLAGGTLFKDVLRGGKSELISDLEADSRWHHEAPRLKALLAAPIHSGETLAGALMLATIRDTPLEAKHLQYVTTLVSVAGTAMGNAAHFEGMQTLLKALLQALATAIDARDPFTAGHSHRVARLAVALARTAHEDRDIFPDVSFNSNELIEVYYAGLLHDVGKIGVREQVLTKASRLPDQHMAVIAMRMALLAELTGDTWETDFAHLQRINRADTLTSEDASLVSELSKRELTAYGKSVPMLTEDEVLALLLPRGNLLPDERREIERHPIESYRILQHIPFPETMRNLLDIICQHHERLDGTGYSSGLKGDEISFMARVLMIVDIYDAITMERHYKAALSRERAMRVLQDEASQGRLDERLVRLLARHIEDIEEESLRMAMHQDFDAIINSHHGAG